MTNEELEDKLRNSPNVQNWCRTGSNYICGPPVTDTDIDYVVFVQVFKRHPHNWFANNPIPSWVYGEGWETGGSEREGNWMDTFRKGKYNLIFVYNEIDFCKWHCATEIAKKRNLLDKEDRIALFDDVFNNYEKYTVNSVKEIEWV